MTEYYEIKIKGQLDQCWSEWFAGLKLTHLEGDVTLLSGLLPDQAALHGLLERVRDLNLTLISVIRGGPYIRNSDKVAARYGPRKRRTRMLQVKSTWRKNRLQ